MMPCLPVDLRSNPPPNQNDSVFVTLLTVKNPFLMLSGSVRRSMLGELEHSLWHFVKGSISVLRQVWLVSTLTRLYSTNKKICFLGGAAVAQWIRLHLPSCRPGFDSQAHHLRLFNLNCNMLKGRKLTEKVAGIGPFFRKYVYFLVRSKATE